MSNRLEKLADLVKKHQETLKMETRDAVFDTVRDVLNRYPELEAIGWVQYTPYFNDGDPCVFGYHDLYYKMIEKENKKEVTEEIDEDEECDDEEYDDEDGDFRDGFYDQYDLDEKKHPKLREELRKLNFSLESIEEGLELAFADHSFIKIYRDRFEVSEYEHD